ncbi:MAG: TonB C-terminal domain-containing protein [Acidobacteria bacterium]|nr:TonB C-terminal domain-containing protein [Acidobacteriota bacterium]
MLVLKNYPQVPEETPELRFQKPGPESERHELGLPPSIRPSGPAQPAREATAGPGRETTPPEDGQRGSRALVPPEPIPDIDVEKKMTVPADVHQADGAPFTSSLENLGTSGPSAGSSRSGSGAPTGSFESGDATFAFDSGGFDLSEWAELVKQKVRSNWVIPTAALMGMKGVVSIYVVIEKNGEITRADIVSSSGIISMDSSSLNAIRSSNRLPPLPAGFPKPNLQGRVTFFYNVSLPRS